MGDIDARFRLQRPEFCLDVTLRMPTQGITVLFGPSGCGKTTLLRCLAGLERTEPGYLRFRDAIWQDAHRWRPAHQRPIGFVFQEASLLPHLSVLGNLDYGMRRRPGAALMPLDQILALLGIGHLLERRPHQLSGGERQRVAIARALATSPRWLLLDEPLAALDAARKREILPYLERMHAELDIPMVYVTHAADEAARLGDHLVVMHEGGIVSSGPLAASLASLNSPLLLGEDVGVVLDAQVVEFDRDWHLVGIDAAGIRLWLPDHGLTAGQRIRVRVLARDVSIALERAQQSSIVNAVFGHIDAIANDTHPGLLLVRATAGSAHLLARITRRSAAHLALRAGQPVWLQVKSVALLD